MGHVSKRTGTCSTDSNSGSSSSPTKKARTPPHPDSESLTLRTRRALRKQVRESHLTDEVTEAKGEKVADLKPTRWVSSRARNRVQV